MTVRAVDLQRLVNTYGEPLTLISKSFGVYNPATGENAVTSTSQTALGYNASYDLAEVDGTTVIRGDRKVIFGSVDTSGQAINPKVDDEVVGRGDKVSIVSVSVIMSGPTPICYICQVRE
jgi:hypothetical protein